MSKPFKSKLTMVIDQDERGSFRGHVENDDGKSVFEFSNEDENGWPSQEGFWMVEDGFLKHGRDADGMLSYLQSVGIASQSATIELVE